jgi:hypothetical protein
MYPFHPLLSSFVPLRYASGTFPEQNGMSTQDGLGKLRPLHPFLTRFQDLKPRPHVAPISRGRRVENKMFRRQRQLQG